MAADDINTYEQSDMDWRSKLNMEFDSEEDAYKFYNKYGRRVRFGVKKHYNSKNKKTNLVTSSVFACTKQGLCGKDKRDQFVNNPRAELRTICDAEMRIKFNNQTKKYYVVLFTEDHNHTLLIQALTHMLPSQRKVTPSQAIEIELADESGIPIRSAYELMGKHAGGRECIGYTKLDQKNYLRSKRQNNLAFGEAGNIITYFSNQAIENPSFYSSLQLDFDEQITNIFWVDAQMIIDYALFGDVVSFDTTYKINKEYRLFAVFVGLNQHQQTVVFGAALMVDDLLV